jgi:hypothetical protein
MDNRRAFYDRLQRFHKYSSDGGAKQALRRMVGEGHIKTASELDSFSDILKDNNVWLVLGSDDKKWIKTAMRRNTDELTRLY